MSGRAWTKHARQRALERYSLALSDADFEAIWDEIKSGRAPCMRLVEEVGGIHVVRFHGDILITAVKTIDDREVITTFMPPDYFCRGTTLKRAQQKNITKQKHKKTASAMNPVYSRARMKRDFGFDEEEG